MSRPLPVQTSSFIGSVSGWVRSTGGMGALVALLASAGCDDPDAVVRVNEALLARLPLEIPRPTGPLPVGARASFATDPSRVETPSGRARAIPVRVWYPARDPGRCLSARYLSPAIQSNFEGALGLPAGSFDVATHAFESPVPRADVRGVILVSGGYQMPSAFETAQVVDLASRGWVLVAFDHPHETILVEQPDGSLIPGDLSPEDAFTESVRDVGVVLDHLPALVPGWRPRTPVGMFGHSLGGAAAAESLRIYPSLLAAVDLDGTPRGAVVQEGLDKPFGIMVSDVRIVEHLEDVDLDALRARLRGPHPFEQLSDINHNGFTDFVVFNPEAAAADPALGQELESIFETDVTTVVAGAASLSVQRAFLAKFFARYLTRH